MTTTIGVHSKHNLGVQLEEATCLRKTRISSMMKTSMNNLVLHIMNPHRTTWLKRMLVSKRTQPGTYRLRWMQWSLYRYHYRSRTSRGRWFSNNQSLNQFMLNSNNLTLTSGSSISLPMRLMMIIVILKINITSLFTRSSSLKRVRWVARVRKIKRSLGC